MLYRLILVLLVAVTVSAQTAKAEPPTDKAEPPTDKVAAPTDEVPAPIDKTAAPAGMEKFVPSQAISVDNAVAFPADI